MFKKLYNKVFKRRKRPKNTIERLNNALHPTNSGVSIVYEEITEYNIKDHLYKLGDKVIARSNECDPLVIGTIVEFWNNNGKWSNCIPQIKDESCGTVWSHMGTIKPYSDELYETLKPMRPLEQWNYLLPDNVKEMYSYSEEDMDRKERQYKNVQRNKEKLV
jgi:hypothetical protein